MLYIQTWHAYTYKGMPAWVNVKKCNGKYHLLRGYVTECYSRKNQVIVEFEAGIVKFCKNNLFRVLKSMCLSVL